MTLIELMIYLALITFIMLASISLIVRFWQTSMWYQKKQVALITIIAAHDLLSDDIWRAPCIKTAWKVQKKTELVWQREDGTYIGWLYEKKSLFRIEGMYKEKEGAWHKKTKNVVVLVLKDILFKCQNNEDVESVDFSLMDDYYTIDARAIPLERLIEKHHSIDKMT